MLGPLTNPARPKRMIVGVFSKDLGQLMAESLMLLGVERAWVVCGAIGLDEISPEGKTHVWDLNGQQISTNEISPADFGLEEHPLKSVKGGAAAHNAAIMRDLLDDKLSGPLLDFVLLNSAALIFVSGKAKDLKDGVRLAREAISSGNAKLQLQNFKDATQ